jgi:hypothetical protein
MEFIQKPLAKLADWAAHARKKRIYYFHEGSADDAVLLGDKGCHLCEMVRLKMPVPAGFVVSSESCREYLLDDIEKKSMKHLVEDYTRAIQELERETGRVFGAGYADVFGHTTASDGSHFPLLLALRSSAAEAMVS